jgi:hypothetical protein
VGGATLDDSALAPYVQSTQVFNSQLSNIGVFDWLLAGMQPGVLHSKFGFLTQHVTSQLVAEGRGKPVTRGAFAADVLDPVKAAALIVLSDAILRHATSLAILDTTMTASAVRSTDGIFLSDISSTALTFVAMGLDPFGILDDLRRAIQLLALGTENRFHIVLKPHVCLLVSMLAGADGRRAFPEMTPSGGVLAGLPARASEMAVDDVTIIDASAFVGVADEVQMRASSTTAIEMSDEPSQASDTPTSSTPNMVSMFQTHSRALLVERVFAWSPMRVGVVKMQSVDWGKHGSPPT